MFLTKWLLSAALLGLIANRQALADEPLVIGVVAPITGRIAPVGTTLRNSMQLAQEERAESRIRFIFEDDSFDPKNSVSAATKLLHVENAKVLVVFGSAAALALVPQTEARQTPLIALAMSDRIIGNSKLAYRWFATAADQTKAIISELHRRNYPSIAVVNGTVESLSSMKEEFDRLSPFKSSLNVEVEPDDVDLRSTALRIKQADPAAVYLLLLPPQFSTLSRRLREVGYRGAFFSSVQAQNPEEVAASKGALDGTWFVGIDNRKAAAFLKDYQARFGESPTVDGTVGYDLAQVLLQAKTKQQILDLFDNADQIQGTFGTWHRSGRHTFAPPLAIREIVDGQIK